MPTVNIQWGLGMGDSPSAKQQILTLRASRSIWPCQKCNYRESEDQIKLKVAVLICFV